MNEDIISIGTELEFKRLLFFLQSKGFRWGEGSLPLDFLQISKGSSLVENEFFQNLEDGSLLIFLKGKTIFWGSIHSISQKQKGDIKNLNQYILPRLSRTQRMTKPDLPNL